MKALGFMKNGRIGTFRIYCIAAAILVVGLKAIVTMPNPYDPLWLRVAIGLYFLLIALLSIRIKWFETRIADLHAVGTALVGLWLCLLLYKNQFHQDIMAGVNMLSVAAVLLFDNKRLVLLFSVATGVGLSAAVMATASPPMPLDSFWGVNMSLLVLANLVVRVRVHTRTNLEMELGRMLGILEAAVESNSDAILLVDMRGNFLKANSAFIHLWKLDEQMINSNLLQKSAHIVLDAVEDPSTLKQVVEGDGSIMPMGERLRFAMKDGRRVELYWRPMIHLDEVVGRLWICRDVTIEFKNEEQLKARELQLTSNNEILMQFATSFVTNAGNLAEAFREITSVSAKLLNVDTVGVWFFDAKGKNMLLQTQYEAASGRFQSDVIVPLSAHPEYFDDLLSSRVLAVPDTTARQSTRRFYQGKYSGKANSLMHAQIRVQGECIGILSFECASVVRDWTTEEQNYASSLADLVAISLASEEKQAAQEELRQSLATLQAIFDLSETGIIVEDVDHNILNYNKLYLQIWNMTAEFIEQNPYSVLLAHCLSMLKNSNTVEEGLERLKQIPGMEYAGIMEFHDGRFVERYSKAVYVDGALKGRVWFYLDITERKLKENELINRNFELDSFVYRASHDLKAPLNSVMGLISLIRQESDVEPIMRYIALMDKSVTKLDEFIRQLTQFSQDARLKVVRKPIEFESLLGDLLSDLKFMNNASRLKINLDILQDGVFHSDPVRLGIIFSNLLSNAIKYQDVKKQDSILDVSVRADEKQLICTLRDNGVGISGEHLEKVFDLFYRASIQATGSGLGLYITHNAVQKLGGTIQVESMLGEGTTFTLNLPSLVATDGQEQDHSQDGPQKQA